MIPFDYANATALRIGPEHGLADAEIDRAVASHGALCARFAAEGRRGDYGFAKLPYQNDVADAVARFAAERKGAFRNFVQIGIGGSALGASALHGALNDRFHNETDVRPRFYVLDNVDPDETFSLLLLLDPKETLYHIVTKSGDTTETMAGFLTVLERLGGRWKSNLVVTTDPKKGFLREFALKNGIPAFDIPEDVGGRFSVLTPVGLLPAAMTGIDIRALLAGAAEMHNLCERTDPRKNPAFMFALVAHLLDAKHGKRIHVMMPYARALRDTADWFRQLWAESLGKSPQVGPTPLLALGTTDQHSQVQLFNEGPNDKFVIFLEVERFNREIVAPQILAGTEGPAFLQGKSFSQILAAMKSGTEEALTQNRRPNATLRLPGVTASTVGALFFLLETATLFAGRMYGVNPFDQPGVEAGKKAAFARLGKPGYPPPPPTASDPRYVVP